MVSQGSSVPATEEVGGLSAVAHPKQLVGSAQMLFYGGLREVKAPAYLGVRESLDHVTQDLPLASREGGEVAGVILGQHVPKQLPWRDELPPDGHRQGAHELVGHHLGVDETGGSCLQGVAGERQVQLGAEDHYRGCVRAQLLVDFDTLGEVFIAVGAEYDAGGNLFLWRPGSLVDPGPLLQGSYEPGAHDRVRAVDPDQAQRLESVLRLAHHGIMSFAHADRREWCIHYMPCIPYLATALRWCSEREVASCERPIGRGQPARSDSRPYVGFRGQFFSPTGRRC